MARETTVERAKRAARDNFLASKVGPFEYESDLFGTVKIGENLGPVSEADNPGGGTDGWDLYDVEHSGVHHRWTSAVVVSIFESESESAS